MYISSNFILTVRRTCESYLVMSALVIIILRKIIPCDSQLQPNLNEWDTQRLSSVLLYLGTVVMPASHFQLSLTV